MKKKKISLDHVYQKHYNLQTDVTLFKNQNLNLTIPQYNTEGNTKIILTYSGILIIIKIKANQKSLLQERSIGTHACALTRTRVRY